MQLLGIDIGGSGIKGALVDIAQGKLIGERQRIETPSGALPKDVASVVAQLTRQFDWKDALGCTFPAIVHHGVTLSAANVDQSWIGTNAKQLFEDATGLPVQIINDADAAGIAEVEFGAGRDRNGLVIMLTFGTGIGSAMFLDGKLMPNSELGHLEIRGKDAEHRASAKVKEDKELSWAKWAERVNEFLNRVEFLFSPDLFIIGGGVSKRHEKFLPLLKTRAEIVPAQFFNDAGIVGAAMAAKSLMKSKADKPTENAPEKSAPEVDKPNETSAEKSEIVVVTPKPAARTKKPASNAKTATTASPKTAMRSAANSTVTNPAAETTEPSAG